MTARPELRELTSYDEDFLLWSEEQADLLRRRAAARPEAFAGLDIDNLVEEIGDLGRSQLSAAESFLELIFVHLIKIVSDPASPGLSHWGGEMVGFHSGLRRAWLPSMRRRIDLEEVWGDALRRVRLELRLHHRATAAGVPERCPYAFDELVADFDVDRAVAKLGGSLPV